MNTVEFSVRVEVEDQDPQVLETKYGKRRVLSQLYVARAGYDSYTWNWSRVGAVLKNDGTPRADNRLEYINVTEVPDYAQMVLEIVVEERANKAKAEIDEWVAAAKDRA